MRPFRGGSLVVWGILFVLTGCRPRPLTESRPLAHPLVEALVAECETMYCEKSLEKAETVIQTGRPALLDLKTAYKRTDDPDVLVWTKACIVCIEKGWPLAHYQEDLRQKMRTADAEIRSRAAAHLRIMGDIEAFTLLKLESVRQARAFFLNMDLGAVIMAFHKRPVEPMYIQMLESENASARLAAFRALKTYLAKNDPPILGFDSGDWDDTSERRREVIQEFERLFSLKREEKEKERLDVCAKGRYKEDFYKYRFLFE